MGAADGWRIGAALQNLPPLIGVMQVHLARLDEGRKVSFGAVAVIS